MAAVQRVWARTAPRHNSCIAGHTAWFWGPPCRRKATHFITSPIALFKFCDYHYDEIMASALIRPKRISKEEFVKREHRRVGRHAFID